MTGLLENKHIIVTGATSGIGAAIAATALREGARVTVHGRTEQPLSPELASAGGRVAFVAADLADPAAPGHIFAAAEAALGAVDGLVNNAGIFPRSTIETDVLAQFDPVFHINARAPLLLSQALIRRCRQNGSAGTIVNIGSINAYCGADMILIYSMSKGALMTMTRNLADSHGAENIRVNQLNVGWTLTEGEIET